MTKRTPTAPADMETPDDFADEVVHGSAAASRSAPEHGETDDDFGEVIELLDRVKSQTPEILRDIFECAPVIPGVKAGVAAEEPRLEGPGLSGASHPRSLSDLISPTVDGAPILIGSFEILEHVGFGGSGVVFRARDTRLKRTVALKIPHPEGLVSQRLRERFVREAEAAASLDHPQVIPVYEAGTEGLISYIAYAFFEGHTLQEWMAGLDDRPDVRVVAHIVKAVAEGVQHAHQRGVLHRDIKPSNVMIAFASTDGSSDAGRTDAETELTVRITDFGMARVNADDVEATRTGTILGTPAYMAPEQSRGVSQTLGPAVDVYSLGALLYELLTRRPPFERDNVVDLLQAVRQTMPIPPSRIVPSVPRDLEVLAMRCLDKSPQARLVSAGFLADELQRFLDGKSILSRPDSTATALVKWSRRHPLIATLAASLLVVAALGSIGIAWQWHKATRALVAVSQAEKEKARLLEETAAQLHVRRIGLAHREILDGRNNRARQILAECEPNRRAWDWYYLNGLSRLELQCWHDFELHPRDLSLDRRGQRLLIAQCIENRPQRGGRWTLIDLVTQEILREQSFEQGGLYGCAFAPDGKTFVTAAQLAEGTEGSLTLWDAETGVEVWRAGAVGHEMHVAFSPDGTLIGSAGYDGTLRVWNTDGELQATLSHGTDNVLQVDFHPTLPLLAAASRSGTVTVWHVDTEELKFSTQISNDLRCARFSPSGRWLGVSGYDGAIHVLDVADDYTAVFSGRNTLRAPTAVYAVDFSTDEQHLLGASTNGEMYLWDLETGAVVSRFGAHAEAIFDCLWLDQSKFATCAALSQEVKLWDSEQIGEPQIAYPQETATADMAIGASGKVGILATEYNRFFGGLIDYRLKVVDLETLETSKVLTGHEAWHTAVAVSNDEKRAISADLAGRVIVWDLKSGEALFELEREATGKQIPSVVMEVAFSADDAQLITVSAAGQLGRWDSQTGERISSRLLSDAPLEAATANQCGSELLIAGASHASLWSLDPPQQISRWTWRTSSASKPERNDSGTRIVELALDETRKFVALAESDCVHCWSRHADGRIAADRPRMLREATDEITSIAFDREGQRIAVANANTTVRLWDPKSGSETMTLRAHSEARGAVSECRFSPAGDRLFACRTFITVWETPPRQPKHHENGMNEARRDSNRAE